MKLWQIRKLLRIPELSKYKKKKLLKEKLQIDYKRFKQEKRADPLYCALRLYVKELKG